MNVPLEIAYKEACQALGEAIVRERLLAAELARLTPPPTSDIVIPTQEDPDDG